MEGTIPLSNQLITPPVLGENHMFYVITRHGQLYAFGDGLPRPPAFDVLGEDRTFEVDGHTMVPLRELSEWLGAQVSYENEQVTVRQYREGVQRIIRLTIGSTQVSAEGDGGPANRIRLPRAECRRC